MARDTKLPAEEEEGGLCWLLSTSSIYFCDKFSIRTSPQRIVSTIYRYANIVWFSKYRWNIVIAFFWPYHTIFLGHFLPIFTYKKFDFWKYPMISVIKEWFYLYHTDFFHKFHAISVKFVKNCRKRDIKCRISSNLRAFLPNRKYRKYRVIIVSKPKILCNIVWTLKKISLRGGWYTRLGVKFLGLSEKAISPFYQILKFQHPTFQL